MSTTSRATSPDTSASLPITPARQALLACLWLPYYMQWGALLNVIWPSQIHTLSPDRWPLWTGVILSGGALVALVTAPLAGALSDRSTSRFGRRRPFLVGGGLLNIAVLIVLAMLGDSR